jgi:threonine/homoserine/homoserine lactone efflux protein
VDWLTYGTFVVFALVLVLVPGPDFAVVSRSTVAAGRLRGTWTGIGVTSSNVVQGVVAVLGLGAVIVASQPLFSAIKWVGVAYLLFLGVQALRSAWRGNYPVEAGGIDGGARRTAWTGWQQGFLSNITNPKVLVFYLAVVPQFLPPEPGLWQLSALALTHAVLSLAYLLLIVAALHQVRRLLARRAVRRGMDTATSVALLGFGMVLAREQLARAA